jgi:hypothetical protein
MGKAQLASLYIEKAHGVVAVGILFVCCWLVAACAMEPEDAGEEVNATVQAVCRPRVGVGCTILRPVGWNGVGTRCMEEPTTPIFREDGQTYEAFAVSGPLTGFGSILLWCHSGCLETLAKTCYKDVWAQ